MPAVQLLLFLTSCLGPEQYANPRRNATTGAEIRWHKTTHKWKEPTLTPSTATDVHGRPITLSAVWATPGTSFSKQLPGSSKSSTTIIDVGRRSGWLCRAAAGLTTIFGVLGCHEVPTRKKLLHANIPVGRKFNRRLKHNIRNAVCLTRYWSWKVETMMPGIHPSSDVSSCFCSKAHWLHPCTDGAKVNIIFGKLFT